MHGHKKPKKNKHYSSTRMKQGRLSEHYLKSQVKANLKCVQTMCFLNNSLDCFDCTKYLNFSQPIYKHVKLYIIDNSRVIHTDTLYHHPWVATCMLYFIGSPSDILPRSFMRYLDKQNAHQSSRTES